MSIRRGAARSVGRLLVNPRWTRRQRMAVGVSAASLLLVLTGCTVQAGAALVVGTDSVSEASVQHDAAAFVAENATAAVTSTQVSRVNRAQITFAVRHALIAQALAARGLTVTTQEITSALSQVAATGTPLTSLLLLPAAQATAAGHDFVALELLASKLPAAGAQVSDVSVTAEGVPAANRDAAVALRSKFLADPASVDAAVAAAVAAGAATGTSALPKGNYSLLSAPSAGSAGLFQAGPGGVVLLPSTATGYLVLRTSSRAVTRSALTPADLSATLQGQAGQSQTSGVSDFVDLAALLVAQYQGNTKIAVNPRYGVWDAASVQVVPGNDGL